MLNQNKMINNLQLFAQGGKNNQVKGRTKEYYKDTGNIMQADLSVTVSQHKWLSFSLKRVGHTEHIQPVFLWDSLLVFSQCNMLWGCVTFPCAMFICRAIGRHRSRENKIQTESSPKTCQLGLGLLKLKWHFMYCVIEPHVSKTIVINRMVFLVFLQYLLFPYVQINSTFSSSKLPWRVRVIRNVASYLVCLGWSLWKGRERNVLRTKDKNKGLPKGATATDKGLSPRRLCTVGHRTCMSVSPM